MPFVCFTGGRILAIDKTEITRIYHVSIAVQDGLSVSVFRNSKDRFSCVMRKPAFCICENKSADQHLCFHDLDSTIHLLF